jgi:hypothetical protein
MGRRAGRSHHARARWVIDGRSTPPLLDSWGCAQVGPHRGVAQRQHVHPSVGVHTSEGTHDSGGGLLSSHSQPSLACVQCGMYEKGRGEGRKCELGFMNGVVADFVRPESMNSHPIMMDDHRRPDWRSRPRLVHGNPDPVPQRGLARGVRSRGWRRSWANLLSCFGPVSGWTVNEINFFSVFWFTMYLVFNPWLNLNQRGNLIEGLVLY